MIPEKKTKTNIAVGIGFLLQLAGFFLVQTKETCAITFLGIILILISIPLLIRGCTNYVVGKGHSKWLGLLALASLIGMVVLIVLPDKVSDGSVHRLQLRKIGGLISLVLGFGIIVLGRWLDRLAYASIFTDARLDHQLGQWPNVCMFVGACIVLVSLLLLLVKTRPNPREGADPG
ncbi:MAG: hypothetical protein ACYSWZ_21160 [Planctomycetota bacterium]|jgi:uncharacterized membrane protein